MNLELKIKIVREIKILEATISLREDGIVRVYYHDNTVLDVSLQLKMVDMFNEITENKKSLFIFEAGDNVVITKEARDNAILLEDSTPILASAVVANNLAYRLIANFYIKVNKPKGNYKIVGNSEEGINWLKGLGVGLLACFVN